MFCDIHYTNNGKKLQDTTSSNPTTSKISTGSTTSTNLNTLTKYDNPETSKILSNPNTLITSKISTGSTTPTSPNTPSKYEIFVNYESRIDLVVSIFSDPPIVNTTLNDIINKGIYKGKCRLRINKPSVSTLDEFLLLPADNMLIIQYRTVKYQFLDICQSH